MLNIPNCLNFDIIPLEMSLTAPYKSVGDLEMIIKLTSSINERLQSFDCSSLKQIDFDNNNCSEMQLRFDSIKKFCGICKFSESNILDRLDDELILLNHLFHNGPDDRIPIDLFKYYFLDQSFNVIKVTTLLFNLIMENYDNDASLIDIINAWKEDNEILNTKITPLLTKIFEISNFDVDLSISKLIKIKQKKKNVQHTDILSLLASKQNAVKEKKVPKISNINDIKSKPDKKPVTKSKNESDELKQLPGQLNLFQFDKSDASNDVIPNILIDKIESINHLETLITTDANTPIKVPFEQPVVQNFSMFQSEQLCDDISSVNYDDINALSIVSGTIFISTKNALVLSIQNQDDKITNYTLNPNSNFNNDFLIHLFLNKNVLKIVDDLLDVKKYVATEVFNSTLDVSIISKDSNIIKVYNEIIRNYTVEELENFKRNNIIKLYTMVNTTTLANVIFKVTGEADLFKNVVYKASQKKVFDKYMVKVFNCSKDSLELFIEKDNNSIAIDYFLSIIRSELKRKNVKKEIEVIIK